MCFGAHEINAHLIKTKKEKKKLRNEMNFKKCCCYLKFYLKMFSSK